MNGSSDFVMMDSSGGPNARAELDAVFNIQRSASACLGPQAVARIGQIATLSAATRKPACQNGASRDLGVARQCSNVFGASLVSVEEID
jgi:hypothetical protein